ncbi:MAG TPA: hypothetical protein VNH11_18625 [Pirellulales bacterium]|nr:hypothetical protein [Pirellulales bacterium]
MTPTHSATPPQQAPVPTEASEPESPRPPSAWRRFWHRYSPNGEFPLSSCSSLAIHVLLVLLLLLMAKVLQKHERAAPGVDVVVVGDGPEAAAGLQAGGPGESSALAETSPTDSPQPADLAELPAEQLQTNVAASPSTASLVADDAVSSEVSQAAQRAAQSAARAREGLARAKERLRKNMSQGGGGTAVGGSGNAAAGNSPGGGGSGATGRAARPGRWILRFRSVSVEDLLAQYAGLGAELAFPTQGDKFRFFYNLTSRPPLSRMQGLEKETRLYWQEANPQSLTGLTQYLGLPLVSYMLAFLPQNVEDRMARMEEAYAGLKEDQIASTTFEVVRRGGGYDVQVVEQKPR